ncbi:MAG: fibronectin type III domain-containing protein [Saprospiraceae bacterium]|nr:fibronectin type III domain-containing protein [Saprospiraceae bacterium]
MNMIKIYLRCWVGLIFIAFLPIFLQAACDLPSQLQVTPGPSQTVFSWSGNGTSYLIEVEKSNSQTIVPEKTVSAPYSHTLAAGSYKFKIRTICGKDKSNWSDWVAFVVNGSTTTNPPSGGGGGSSVCDIPTALASAISGQEVTLSWTGSATQYQIEVENESTNVKVVPEQNASSPFGLTLANGTYKFKVRSVCGGDHSDWSAWSNFVINGSTTTNPPSGGGGGSRVCDIPTALASAISGQEVTLSWTGSATQYQIEVENESTNVKVVPEQNASSPFGLTLANGTYKFKVRSVCGGDHSDWSAWSNFVINGSTTTNPPSGGGGGSSVCDIPTALASAISGQEVTLTWTGSATQYQIEVENESTNVKVVPEQNASSPFGLTLANGTYKFKVRSVCGGDHSDWSAWSNFVINGSTTTNPPSGGGSGGGGGSSVCDIPTALASAISGQEVTLSWTGSATQYQIEVENESTNVKVVPEQNASSPFGLTLANGTYKFKVRSVCGGDHSDWSDWAFFNVGQGGGAPTTSIDNTCINTVIINLIISKDTSMTLSWASVTNAVSYTVEIESEHTVENFRFKIEDYRDTMIVVNGLTPNTQYKISISTECGKGLAPGAPTIQSVTPPTASTGNTTPDCEVPPGVIVSILSTNSARFSWLPVAGVKTYQLEIVSEENTPDFLQKIAVAGTSFTLNNLVPGGIYKFKVRSVCPLSKSKYSTPIIFKQLLGFSNEVTLEKRKAFKSIRMDLYPNPVSTQLNIELEVPFNSMGTIQIINTNSQIMAELKNTLLTETMSMNVAHLTPGVYFVRVWSNQMQNIKKLVVEK